MFINGLPFGAVSRPTGVHVEQMEAVDSDSVFVVYLKCPDISNSHFGMIALREWLSRREKSWKNATYTTHLGTTNLIMIIAENECYSWHPSYGHKSSLHFRNGIIYGMFFFSRRARRDH